MKRLVCFGLWVTTLACSGGGGGDGDGGLDGGPGDGFTDAAPPVADAGADRGPAGDDGGPAGGDGGPAGDDGGPGGDDGGPACTPAPEQCNGLDDDCDGAADEDIASACYTGPAGTRDVGACRAGTQTCVAGAFGACAGEVLPADEDCDGLDDDCDGVVDEGACPVCGDGTLDEDEGCDDGNQDDGDGCSSACEFELEPEAVLVCGALARDLADVFERTDHLALMAGCAPDADTRAVLITPDGVDDYDAAALRSYVALGGNVITSGTISDDVYGDFLGTAVAEGEPRGACGGALDAPVRLNRDDPFWHPIERLPMGAPDQSGCGRDMADFPGISALAGWNAATVSVAYRAFGVGRLWLVESDWPAAGPPLSAASRQMLRSMVRWQPARQAPGVQQNIPVAALEARGFAPCHVESYAAEGTPLADIVAACGGAELALGCRAAGADALDVVAEGDFAQVLLDVGDGLTARHSHNGVAWYLGEQSSWGFAPAGSAVHRVTCDARDEDGDRRMCWHTSAGNLMSGYRCGRQTTFGDDVERVIYVRGDTVGLGPSAGFGHAGACDAWNGCGDGATCAGAACALRGQGPAVTWEEGACGDLVSIDANFDCDLFRTLPADVDADFEPDGCGPNVAFDVRCAPPRGEHLGALEGFGHDGGCAGWNACGDAATCAAAACEARGHGAPISWREDTCAARSAAVPGFSCSLFTDLETGALTPRWLEPDCDPAVAYDVVCSPGILSFSGVRQAVPVADVERGGFRVCWEGDYGADDGPVAAIDAACDGDVLLLGCSTDDLDVLDVAAMGERAIVVGDHGAGPQDSVEHNDVQWYRSPSQSWGFAPAGVAIHRNSCDIGDERADERLCWHLSAGSLLDGFSCGDARFIAAGRRVIYHRPGPL
ncbi:MAG: hypothetical protein H6704_02690 [Myxococcales bacterium]|nr:hypothetical protein [Myxococcales bacterium]